MARERKRKPPRGRPPSERDRRSHRVTSGPITEKQVEKSLDDLERRGLIQVDYQGERRGIRPLIGARQYLTMMRETGEAGADFTISDQLSDEATIDSLGVGFDPETVIATMVRHAHMFPGGVGARNLGEVPKVHRTPGVEIRTILPDEIGDAIREFGESMSVGEIDQALMELEEFGYLHTTRSPKGDVTAYQMKYVDGELVLWSDDEVDPDPIED